MALVDRTVSRSQNKRLRDIQRSATLHEFTTKTIYPCSIHILEGGKKGLRCYLPAFHPLDEYLRNQCAFDI